VLDEDLARVYAGALVAIGRADGELVLDEVLRIRTLVAERTGRQPDDATLFGDDIGVDDVVAAATHRNGDPFRSTGPSPRELGRMLIADGLLLALADGGVHDAEVAFIVRLGRALGCTDDDFAQFRARLPAWLAL
jgi:hypothetical protein